MNEIKDKTTEELESTLKRVESELDLSSSEGWDYLNKIPDVVLCYLIRRELECRK